MEESSQEQTTIKLGKIGRFARRQKKSAKTSGKNRWCYCDSWCLQRRGEKCPVCRRWHGLKRSKKVIPDYEFE